MRCWWPILPVQLWQNAPLRYNYRKSVTILTSPTWDCHHFHCSSKEVYFSSNFVLTKPFTNSKRWSDDFETADRIQDLENHEDREDLCNFIILLIRRSTFTWLSSLIFSNLFQSKHLKSEVSNWFWEDLSNFVVQFWKMSRIREISWFKNISRS